MHVTPITTRRCQPPQDDISDIYRSLVPLLRHGMVVAVSSKIVAIEEGRCLPMAEVEDKDALIARESDRFLPRDAVRGRWVMHTLTHNTLIPSAGIDESNADDHYILWPKEPMASAERICRFLRAESGLKGLGVVLTDSHSAPLRRGVVGLAIGHWGFAALADYRGSEDLFGRAMKISQSNMPDALAAAAVLVMGEGAESTPIALMDQLPATLRFTDGESEATDEFGSYSILPEFDLYAPFLEGVEWREGGRRDGA